MKTTNKHQEKHIKLDTETHKAEKEGTIPEERTIMKGDGIRVEEVQWGLRAREMVKDKVGRGQNKGADEVRKETEGKH